MPCAYPLMAFVLVSMPNKFAAVTRTFGDEQRLLPAAQRSCERRLRAAGASLDRRIHRCEAVGNNSAAGAAVARPR